MPANPVPIDVKTKGQTWLLPPYNWSHRRIAKELDVSPSVVSKWGNELVESEKWTPMVGHISSFLKWLIQLMPRISACRSRLHQG